MLLTSITLDADDRKKIADFLRTSQAEFELAQVRALNKAATQGRNEIQRELNVNLPAKAKKADLRVGRKARKGKTQTSVNAIDRDRNLSQYGGFSETRGRVRNTARGTQTIAKRIGVQGVRVKPFKDRPAVRYPHGFVLRHGANAKGVAAHRALRGFAQEKSYTLGYEENKELQGGVARGGLVGRMPLYVLAGPTVGEEFAGHIDAYTNRLVNLYDKKLSQEINYILSKRR